MAKYLFQGSYSLEGARGLQREGGTRRRGVVEALLKSLGGHLECFYYGFGETDLYMIADLPDNVAAASASLIVASSGAGHWRTTPLFTAEEMDTAARNSGQYRAPGL